MFAGLSVLNSIVSVAITHPIVKQRFFEIEIVHLRMDFVEYPRLLGKLIIELGNFVKL